MAPCVKLHVHSQTEALASNGRQQEVDELPEEINSTEPESPAEKESRVHLTDGLRPRLETAGRLAMGLRNYPTATGPSLFVVHYRGRPSQRWVCLTSPDLGLGLGAFHAVAHPCSDSNLEYGITA